MFAVCFADRFGVETNGRAIRLRFESLGGIGLHQTRVSMDPSGNSWTVSARAVCGEFMRAGLRGRNGLKSWRQEESRQREPGRGSARVGRQ